ncbi:YncE family protein [Conexibacter sp. W3-3-2]|uniref:YncE family protein n=1 Tax=Conexibacter sp. W3-3-2 TaxID=2675227 RepID=UPI0018AA55FE|nr:hypothetical protein [Conexibacter sp. W3-3-2]
MLGAMTGAAGWAASGSLLDGVARAADTAPCTPTAPGTRTSAIALAPGARSAWTADAGATTISRVRVRDLVRGPARDVGGSPLALTLTPDGRTALVLTAAHDRPGLVLVDLIGTATDRVDVGAAPRALAVTADGRHAWVAGEEGLLRVTLADGAVEGPIALGGRPRAVALLPDGRRAAVTDHTGAALLLVDLRRRRVLRRIATSPFPSELALAARGTRALVTHDGYGATGVTLVDLVRGRALRTLRTGADPAGVAVDARGTVALVANAGDGTVSVLDLRSGRHRRRARPGGAPRAVAVAGRRGIAVDGDTGLLTAVPLTKGPR